MGDHIFKVDRLWCSKVLMNAEQPFKFHSARPEELVGRIFTPPYLSNKPEVKHVDLAKIRDSGKDKITLVLCSDGLVDLFEARDEFDLKDIARRWMELGSATKDDEGAHDNGALRILREGLGGKDVDKVAQWLTVEMDYKWLDDITAVVYRIQ